MQTTANLNLQKKNYPEVESHNNRVKSRTKNRNIAWRFTKYDVLNQRPENYNQLMNQQWSGYVKHHDLMRRKNGHANDQYGSVKSMLHQRKSVPYRAVVIGFGSGKIRKKIHREIHRAYPELHLQDVLKIEAGAMNKVPKVYNRLFPKMPITDYAVHVDEFKYHTGQLHLQGRVALLGKTAKGKPSFSLNQAVKQSVKPHLDEYKTLYQQVYGKPLKRKPRNARERLSAYRLLADHATYKTVGSELEKAFPKAHFDFSFTRTEAKSVSHDRWQRERDNQRAERNAERASEASSEARQQANLASLARSSADELVPTFKHRYSSSASHAWQEAKQATNQASNYLSNSYSNADVLYRQQLDRSSASASASVSASASFAIFSYKSMTARNASAYKTLLDSSVASAKRSVASASQSVFNASGSIETEVNIAKETAHKINHQLGIGDQYDYLHGYDEVSVYKYAHTPNPLKVLHDKALPRIKNDIRRIAGFKARFETWIEKRAKQAWASMPAFLKGVHNTESNVSHALKTDKGFSSVTEQHWHAVKPPKRNPHTPSDDFEL